jgi:hypothetical protein
MWEDEMRREGIGFEPVRRKGSRRFQGEEIEARRARRVVETVGSVLRLYFGKRVQAVTLRGFLLKEDNDGDYQLQPALSLLPCLLRWQLGFLYLAKIEGLSFPSGHCYILSRFVGGGLLRFCSLFFTSNLLDLDILPSCYNRLCNNALTTIIRTTKYMWACAKTVQSAECEALSSECGY